MKEFKLNDHVLITLYDGGEFHFHKGKVAGYSQALDLYHVDCVKVEIMSDMTESKIEKYRLNVKPNNMKLERGKRRL